MANSRKDQLFVIGGAISMASVVFGVGLMLLGDSSGSHDDAHPEEHAKAEEEDGKDKAGEKQEGDEKGKKDDKQKDASKKSGKDAGSDSKKNKDTKSKDASEKGKGRKSPTSLQVKKAKRMMRKILRMLLTLN